MPDALPTIDSTDEAIKALGGNRAVGELIGVSHKAVSNWKAWGRNRFPAETYLVLSSALERKGFVADPRLWGMIISQSEAA